MIALCSGVVKSNVLKTKMPCITVVNQPPATAAHAIQYTRGFDSQNGICNTIDAVPIFINQTQKNITLRTKALYAY